MWSCQGITIPKTETMNSLGIMLLPENKPSWNMLPTYNACSNYRWSHISKYQQKKVKISLIKLDNFFKAHGISKIIKTTIQTIQAGLAQTIQNNPKFNNQKQNNYKSGKQLKKRTSSMTIGVTKKKWYV